MVRLITFRTVSSLSLSQLRGLDVQNGLLYQIPSPRRAQGTISRAPPDFGIESVAARRRVFDRCTNIVTISD